MIRRVLISVLAPSLAYAQQAVVEEPPQLAEYREAFEAQLAERTKPLTAAYVRSLENLENVRAIREDYEGALRAKRRRMQLQGEIEVAAPVETSDVEGTIILPLAKARLSGNTVTYDDKRGALVGFKRPRHSATWEIIKVTPGWYKVLTTYGCADSYQEKTPKRDRSDSSKPSSVEMKAGGVFAFYEDTNLIKDTSPPIRKTVVSTGGWDKLVTRNIGKLKLTGTTSTLKLEALEAENLGIMYLRQLKLVPDVAPGTTVSLSADDVLPAELRDLREQYRKQVELEIKDSIEAYLVELKEIEERYQQASKLEEAVATRAERERVEMLLFDPALVIGKP